MTSFLEIWSRRLATSYFLQGDNVNIKRLPRVEHRQYMYTSSLPEISSELKICKIGVFLLSNGKEFSQCNLPELYIWLAMFTVV